MKQTVNIKEEIKKLVEVQKLDAEKYDLQSMLETFPEKIQEMDVLLEAKKNEAQNTGEELKTLQVLKNEKETEMQIKEEKINKHKTDLYKIKNNKEYTALEQEIKSIEADVSILEEEIIGYFDKIEEARILSEKNKTAFEMEGKKIEQKKTEIAAEEKELTEKLIKIDNARSSLTKDIAPRILEVYERIIKNKGRIALAKVNGDFCGGCNMQLRPQIVNDAKLQKNIVSCENCGRMIYAQS
ncbi:MAG: hypothetical protein ISS33_06430 [Candidatus Omnitrophica bacterium]|nr:hypothetical protein [Candidatus Omnitrophota bacterium]